MNYVYIDESGDLGRSDSSSRYIILTAIATKDSRRLDKIVRKVWTTKQHKKDAGELHAIESTDSTRFKLLSLLDEMDIKIRYIVIDKVKEFDNLHNQYYLELAKLVKLHKNAHVCIIDRRDTDKKRTKIITKLKLFSVFKNVEFADSRAVRQLQAVDFVSWSIFQSFENNENSYIDTIRRKIVEK